MCTHSTMLKILKYNSVCILTDTVCCKRPTHTKDSYQPVGVLSDDRAHEGTQGKLSGMSNMVPTKRTQPFLR